MSDQHEITVFELLEQFGNLPSGEENKEHEEPVESGIIRMREMRRVRWPPIPVCAVPLRPRRTIPCATLQLPVTPSGCEHCTNLQAAILERYPSWVPAKVLNKFVSEWRRQFSMGITVKISSDTDISPAQIERAEPQCKNWPNNQPNEFIDEYIWMSVHIHLAGKNCPVCDELIRKFNDIFHKENIGRDLAKAMIHGYLAGSYPFMARQLRSPSPTLHITTRETLIMCKWHCSRQCKHIGPNCGARLRENRKKLEWLTRYLALALSPTECNPLVVEALIHSAHWASHARLEQAELARNKQIRDEQMAQAQIVRAVRERAVQARVEQAAQVQAEQAAQSGLLSTILGWFVRY